MAEQGRNDHLAVKLLAWYDQNARVLPWRAISPARMDPYRVWLSEIMLQQTTVATVKDYFLKFIRLWPSIQALATAPREDVLKAWAGLGYYARARNLHKCAQAVSADFGGNFPDDIAQLLKLPGVGPYTAGAIAAIAFDKPFAAVDGNVERVISRLYAIETPLPESKPDIRKRTQSLTPATRAGDFAQALMDLGATICTPKNPRCNICPWIEQCEGQKRAIASTLPRKLRKKAKPVRKGHAYFALNLHGEVLLRQRPEKGLLGGMTEVPGSTWEQVEPNFKPPLEAKWSKKPEIVVHAFTHFYLHISVWTARAVTVFLPDQTYRWVHLSKVNEEALPTVMRKIVAKALEQQVTHSE